VHVALSAFSAQNESQIVADPRNAAKRAFDDAFFLRPLPDNTLNTPAFLLDCCSPPPLIASVAGDERSAHNQRRDASALARN